MQEIVVSLHLSAEKYLAYYQGAAQHVLAYSQDRRRVQFPAYILRPFLTHQGISGTFIIRFTADNRFHSIEKLS